ncbi:MAG: hypothetical protein NTW29_10375 [Bacteroidetes bacterium]|nr:hypothetical protein [Bacteroidota bacterium]
MLKYLLSLFTTGIITGHVFSQVPAGVAAGMADMQRTLQQKNFTALEAKMKIIGGNWETLRELLPGVQEGVLEFGYAVRDTIYKEMATTFNFKVTLIAAFNQIINYTLSEKKYRKVEDDYIPYYVVIDSVRIEPAYDSLKTAFQLFYEEPLLEADLFMTDIIYGRSCGFAGMPPSQRETIDTLVKKRDQATLLKWLRSANTEKQFYAVDGLYQLKKAGIQLTEKDLQLIRFVLNKKGFIQVCSGCIFSSRKISELAERLDFR